MSLLLFIPLLIQITSSSLLIGDLQECIKSQRIIGGICTSITDRPFQALLFIENEPKCGASIISKRWILTAAHCVQRVPERYLTIGVGSSKVGGCTVHECYTIVKKIVHENFFVNRSMVENDIALLKTSKSIEYNNRVMPIDLNRIPPKGGEDTMVSGYGVTAVDVFGQTSEYLMSVDGKVISKNECESILRKSEPQLTISKGTFCAGNLIGGKDSCQGDSGGPITIGTVLTGIVSWGLKCAEKMMPAFYTDVSYYFDWIVKNIRRNGCRKKSKKRGKSKNRKNQLLSPNTNV